MEKAKQSDASSVTEAAIQRKVSERNRNSRKQKAEPLWVSPIFPQSSAPWQELFRRVAKEFRQD